MILRPIGKGIVLLVCGVSCALPYLALGSGFPDEVYYTTLSSYLYSTKLAADGSPNLLYLGVAITVTGGLLTLKDSLRSDRKIPLSPREGLARDFIGNNRARLEVELARGRGEYLDTLTHLLVCPAESTALVTLVARQRFVLGLRDEQIPPIYLWRLLRSDIESDPSTREICAPTTPLEE